MSRAALEPGEVVAAAGCRVTTPLRTAWDLARRLSLVVAVDARARIGGFAPADLLVRRARRPGARDCRRLDRAVTLADPPAESPTETRLRVGLVLAGLPPPYPQYVVRDEYGFALARADLAYPEVKLAIEYDGSRHFNSRSARRDRQRDAELAVCGWLTLRLTEDDVLAMPQTVTRVRTLLAQRGPS